MRGDDSAQGVLDCHCRENEARRFAESEAGYSRETVLVSCLGLLIVLLALTAFVSRMYHKKMHVLADQWFAKGEAEFRAGNALEAAKDYRNALVYSEGNNVFQFHLAQALVAGHKDEEAQSYLLNLLAESPGSGEINLELARIAARRKGQPAVQDTMRYYYGAIYGVWEGNPLSKRWDARLELCQYLLSRGAVAQAQPEILGLAQDVPPGDLGREKQAAAMLMRAGLWDHALVEYKSILVGHRRDLDALAGAGVAAFQLGQYPLAVEYLDALPRSKRQEPDISGTFALAHEIEAVSPYSNRLSRMERARRTVEALARAKSLAETCSQQSQQNSGKTSATPATPPAGTSAVASDLQKLQNEMAQNQQKWKELNFIRDPAQIDAAMNWVFRVENAAQRACGQPQNLMDRALLLIAKSHASAEA